jgi:predicted phage tail protein
LTQRHTVASVSWLDLANQDVAYEYVEDEKAIAKYGVIIADVTGFACTSRTQAARLGRMLIATEQTETEVVTFSVPLDAGVQVRPGMRVSISDPMKVGARQGGRITGGATSTVALDVTVGSLPAASNPTVQALLTTGVVESRAVTGMAGSTLTVSPVFSAAPLTGGPYIYAETITQWTVLGVREDDRCKYAITALKYNSQKYATVDRGVPLGDDGFPTLIGQLVQVDALAITVTFQDVLPQVGEALILPVDPLVIGATFQDVVTVDPEITTLPTDALSITVTFQDVSTVDPTIIMPADPMVVSVVFQDVATVDPEIALSADVLAITGTFQNVITVAS